MSLDNLTHRRVATNGVTLHLVEAGPADGPLVILLHGFPEFWYGWRRQIPFLAGQGYRVWAPDQRGYNESDKPKGIAAYRLDELAADVLGLIDASGRERAILVGHDWGAAVAWWTAIKAPERLDKLVILNVPHPTVFLRTVRRSPRQLLKSWYIFAFQLPWLPERLARRNNWRSITRTMQSSSRPGTFTDEDMEQYRQAWSRPGAYTAMINWYRAALRQPAKPPANSRITTPTLMIWGAQDKFLSRQMGQPSIDLCDHGRLEFFEDATHWVQHEEADQVNALLAEFLAG